jgi:hypothetical protein
MNRPMMTAALAAAALGAVTAAPLRAQDGVIEINQARALAGGVTPGDTAGFPVTIDAPGSYRLTSNLDITGVATPADTDVVVVSAHGVTVDLNGFGLVGSTVCSYSVGNPGSVLCNPSSGVGSGVEGPGYVVVVRNGFVRGMGDNGIQLSFVGRVENLIASSNRNVGIVAGSVDRSMAMENGTDGIEADHRVVESSAIKNGFEGILSELTIGSVAQDNGSTGIRSATILDSQASGNAIGFQASGLLAGSVATDNSGFGALLADGGYRGCAFSGNNGAGAEVSGGVQLGPNLCNGVVCP